MQAGHLFHRLANPPPLSHLVADYMTNGLEMHGRGLASCLKPVVTLSFVSLGLPPSVLPSKWNQDRRGGRVCLPRFRGSILVCLPLL